MTSAITIFDIPLELRDYIWQSVLLCDVPIVPGRPIGKIAVNISLLCVCSTIRDEALPVFYSTNTVRIDGYADLRNGGTWTRHVRRLKVCNIPELKFILELDLPRTERLAQRYPKLKQLTIVWDGLGHYCSYSRTHGIKSILAREKIYTARYIDVGKLELPNDRVTIFFEHHGIGRAWEEVKAAGGVDVTPRLSWREWPLYETISLPYVIALFDLYLSIAVPGWATIRPKLTSLQAQAVCSYWSYRLKKRPLPAGLPFGMPIRDIEMAKHGEEVVVWLTSILESLEMRHDGTMAHVIWDDI